MMKLGRLLFDVELFERIVTAADNDYVTTDCPLDLKIVRVFQDADDQANHRVTLVVTSESIAEVSDEIRRKAMISGDPEGIPLLMPFTYTVRDPDEDESPPPTDEETSP